MFESMVLKWGLGEVRRLQNAMKKRIIRIDTITPYWPFRDIAELGKWCLVS